MKKYLKDEEAGTTRNEMEPPGNSRHYLEQAGPIQYRLKLPGTSWNQQQTDTKNKKLTGRDCGCNTVAQQKTT